MKEQITAVFFSSVREYSFVRFWTAVFAGVENESSLWPFAVHEEDLGF